MLTSGEVIECAASCCGKGSALSSRGSERRAVVRRFVVLLG